MRSIRYIWATTHIWGVYDTYEQLLIYEEYTIHMSSYSYMRSIQYIWATTHISNQAYCIQHQINAQSKNAQSKNAQSKNAQSKNAQSKNAQYKNVQSKNVQSQEVVYNHLAYCIRFILAMYTICEMTFYCILYAARPRLYPAKVLFSV